MNIPSPTLTTAHPFIGITYVHSPLLLPPLLLPPFPLPRGRICNPAVCVNRSVRVPMSVCGVCGVPVSVAGCGSTWSRRRISGEGTSGRWSAVREVEGGRERDLEREERRVVRMWWVEVVKARSVGRKGVRIGGWGKVGRRCAFPGI